MSKKIPEYIVKRDMKNPIFKTYMLFPNIEVSKKAMKKYEIVNKVFVKLVMNNKDRANTKCKNCDGWMLNASELKMTNHSN